MNWWLPLEGSTYASPIDGLFVAILIITGIAFVVVEAAVIWFSLRYRHQAGRKALHTHGNVTAEIIWTAIPAVTVIALGVISNFHWKRIKGRDSIPADAYPIAIHAKQFEWRITYPGADGQLGNDDDFTMRNQLHLPLGRNVAFELTSEDVIHAFWVPEFRLKQDIVPGMTIRAWVQPTVAGEYELGCAELCGMQHYRMRARVFVHSVTDFDTWLTEQTQQGAE
jgi:cytochrome c oxidase subunit 2